MYIFNEERDGNIFKMVILIEALIQVFSKISHDHTRKEKKSFKAVFTCTYQAVSFTRDGDSYSYLGRHVYNGHMLGGLYYLCEGPEWPANLN